MKSHSIISAVIIGVFLLLAAVVFAVVTELVAGADTGAELRMQRLEDRIETQESEMNSLKRKLDDLEEQVRNRAAQTPVIAEIAPDFGIAIDENPDAPSTEGLTEELILAASRFNQEVQRPRASFMLATLGHPRESYSQECGGVTNPRLKAVMETRQIGPIRVTMLRPALDSLARVMERLQAEEPEIYSALGTAGALCARYVRGSSRSVSSHAWGAAVDLTLEGALDRFANGETQFGLVILAEFFNDEGWFWGAGYGREDSMHFEVGEDLVTQWVTEGLL